MTVKELKEKLSAFDDNMEVDFSIHTYDKTYYGRAEPALMDIYNLRSPKEVVIEIDICELNV